MSWIFPIWKKDPWHDLTGNKSNDLICSQYQGPCTSFCSLSILMQRAFSHENTTGALLLGSYSHTSEKGHHCARLLQSQPSVSELWHVGNCQYYLLDPVPIVKTGRRIIMMIIMKQSVPADDSHHLPSQRDLTMNSWSVLQDLLPQEMSINNRHSLPDVPQFQLMQSILQAEQAMALDALRVSNYLRTSDHSQ